MTGRDILTDLTAAGITITAVGDRLNLRPTVRVTSELVALVRAHKAALLALLCPPDGLAWRVAAMRRQVPPRGSIPFLVAVPGLPPTPGRCRSCYALIETDRVAGRCLRCSEAAQVVLGWAPPSVKEALG